MEQAINIGGRIEMLVDDALIARSEGVQFRLNKPRECGIAITTDKPWEQHGSFVYNSVVSYKGKYFLYYRASACARPHDDRDPGQYLCVAVSEDGENWIKPELDIVPFREYKKTNILMAGEEWGLACHNMTPTLDTNPACPPDQKIKAVGGYDPEGLFLFASEDGFHFRKLSDKPIVTNRLLDSQNVLLYDQTAGLYRIYSRYWHNEEDKGMVHGSHRKAPADPYAAYSSKAANVRAIECYTSEDCIHWSEPEQNIYTNGEPRENLYTNATIPCPGAEHMLLSFPMRFEPERVKEHMQDGPGVADAVFMTSRDGHLWDRRFCESWVGGGFDPKRWTQRNNMPARGLVEKDDCFYAYIGSHYCWDDACILRYSVRKYGFASMWGGEPTGWFETKPLIFAGDSLEINYATTATGGIRAAVIDPETGEPFEGFGLEDCEEMFGDVLFEKLKFRGGSLAGLAGRPVIVRFFLRQADLFAYRFA